MKNLTAEIEAFRASFQLPRKPPTLVLAEQTFRTARQDRLRLEEEQRNVITADRERQPFGSTDSETKIRALTAQIEAAKKAERAARAALDAERQKFNPVYLDKVCDHRAAAQLILGDGLRQIDDILAPLLDAAHFASANKLETPRVLNAALQLAEMVRQMRRTVTFEIGS